MRLSRHLIFLLMSLLVCNCTVFTKKVAIFPQIGSPVEGEYEISPEITKSPPRTVAILPMVNRTHSDQAFDVVRRTLYNHFSSLRYTDLELYEVDAKLKEAQLTNAEEVAKTSPARLGEILGVDAVMYGEITHYDRIYAGLYSQVSVGARLTMVDTKTGKVLWKGEHTARKHQGGFATTPVGLILTAVSTAMNVREIELFRTSDDLFRTMVQAIPSPTLGEARRPPKITILVHDAVGRPKKTGDLIRVAMEGEARMQASFDIGDFKKNIPMREESYGSYVGEYRVLPGDMTEEAIISGQLTDDAGNSSRWIDVLGTVTIDTEPPAAPQGLAALGRDRLVHLSWKSNEEKDLAGYRLYRSDTPLTGFVEVRSTELNRTDDQDLENGRAYYFQVTALDLAGNESKPSAKVMTVPIAPGPTRVRGDIRADTIWFAGASPYLMEEEVVVADGTTLSVESGTEIISSGAALVVKGKLNAVGEEGRTIIFRGADGHHWQGIRLGGSSESMLVHCSVKDAEIGLLVQSASPKIKLCEFADNDVGIRVAESFAEPIISENALRDNRKSGLEIVDAAAPEVQGNVISNNKGSGVLLETAGGKLTDNKITFNDGGGILAVKSATVISLNNIHDNQLFDLRNLSGGNPLKGSPNWWGTTNTASLLTMIQGRVELTSIFDSPYPGGKEVVLKIWQGPLQGKIEGSVSLVQAHSPYLVDGSVVIDGGAVITVQPGVELRFNPGRSALLVRDGGIEAQGTVEYPIIFTSNSGSGSAGFYENAVRFEVQTSIPSFFKYCIFRHAKDAMVIDFGSPDIAYTLFAHNSQSAIQCRNNSRPKVYYSTLRDNSGTGAIECYGNSAPEIHRNNIYQNPFAIQSFSSLYVDARENWWGKAPVDPGLFIGQVNSDGALQSPVSEAFDPETSGKSKAKEAAGR
jgi:parallel beta-helix repeat protein